MAGYGVGLPVMQLADMAIPPAVAAAGEAAVSFLYSGVLLFHGVQVNTLRKAIMRCGGCGSKVGASVLERAIARVPKPSSREDVVCGLGSPDDAALARYGILLHFQPF